MVQSLRKSHNHHTTPGSVIHEQDYKLIHYYEDNHLYNLAKDLSEIHNLAQDMPEKTQDLFQKLQQWLQENKAKMLTPNPDYDQEILVKGIIIAL